MGSFQGKYNFPKLSNRLISRGKIKFINTYYDPQTAQSLDVFIGKFYVTLREKITQQYSVQCLTTGSLKNKHKKSKTSDLWCLPISVTWIFPPWLISSYRRDVTLCGVERCAQPGLWAPASCLLYTTGKIPKLFQPFQSTD